MIGGAWNINYNVPVFLYGAGRNDFDWGKSISRAIEGGGGGPENRDFLGPEMVMSEASVIWAQKRELSHCTSSAGP